MGNILRGGSPKKPTTDDYLKRIKPIRVVTRAESIAAGGAGAGDADYLVTDNDDDEDNTAATTTTATSPSNNKDEGSFSNGDGGDNDEKRVNNFSKLAQFADVRT